MLLILTRNDCSDDPDRFLVTSGKAAVGTLMRVPGREKQGWWHWSITGFHAAPTELDPGAGMAPSRKQAMEEFASRWRSWLDWAGLREIEDTERGSVRLP